MRLSTICGLPAPPITTPPPARCSTSAQSRPSHRSAPIVSAARASLPSTAILGSAQTMRSSPLQRPSCRSATIFTGSWQCSLSWHRPRQGMCCSPANSSGARTTPRASARSSGIESRRSVGADNCESRTVLDRSRLANSPSEGGNKYRLRICRGQCTEFSGAAFWLLHCCCTNSRQCIYRLARWQHGYSGEAPASLDLSGAS